MFLQIPCNSHVFHVPGMFFIVRGRLRVVHEDLPPDAPPPPTILMEPPQWIGDVCMYYFFAQSFNKRKIYSPKLFNLSMFKI